MEPDIKSILERRIAEAVNKIAESESIIASEELYRNKWLIQKSAFIDLFTELNESSGRGSDIALANEAMNTHVHVNVEPETKPLYTGSTEEKEYLAKVNEISTANPEPFVPVPPEPKKEHCKVFTEIEPFKEVPGFELAKSRIPQQIGKEKAYLVDDTLAIFREQYHIWIYTTLEEIRRLKSLPETTVKLTLQDYEKRTYPNKAVVLRHFLRDLKDVSELKVDLTKPKVIPTFSTMKEVDEAKK